MCSPAFPLQNEADGQDTRGRPCPTQQESCGKSSRGRATGGKTEGAARKAEDEIAETPACRGFPQKHWPRAHAAGCFPDGSFHVRRSSALGCAMRTQRDGGKYRNKRRLHAPGGHAAIAGLLHLAKALHIAFATVPRGFSLLVSPFGRRLSACGQKKRAAVSIIENSCSRWDDAIVGAAGVFRGNYFMTSFPETCQPFPRQSSIAVSYSCAMHLYCPCNRHKPNQDDQSAA